jgi:hypothetical protein
MREARSSRVNRLRDIDLGRKFRGGGFRKLEVVGTGSGLRASWLTRRRQFYF